MKTDGYKLKKSNKIVKNKNNCWIVKSTILYIILLTQNAHSTATKIS